METLDLSSIKDIPIRCDAYEIGICDDGENTCSQIEGYLLRYAKEKSLQFDVKIWHTGEALKDYLSIGGRLDILFLDIELVMMTGIEVGHYIRKDLDDIQMQLIYISGKPSYAQQLFKTQPTDFLLKPISYEQIAEVMETTIKILKRKTERFEFQQGKERFYVSQGSIMYFESQGRKIRLFTPTAVYDFYGKLNDIKNGLSEDFIAIHKSFIINKHYVKRYTYETVEMENGDILGISQNQRRQVRDTLLRSE